MKSFLALSLLIASVATAHILPRQSAPQFRNVNAVINGAFKKVSLNDYAGKYLVLLFYPFDFTYVCPTELISFSDNI